VKRRGVLALAGAAALAPAWTLAQQPGRMYKLGVLGFGERAAVQPMLEPFLAVLAKAGFAEGRNLAVDLHLTASESLPLDDAAAQVVAAKPDAIFVGSNPGVYALQRATKTIPIVAVIGFDPVKAGLIESFAHPGGNLTGVSLLSVETGNKRLEVLKEAFPDTRRVYYLNQKANLHFIENDRVHAQRLGIEIAPAVVESGQDVETFFARRFSAEGVSVATSQLNYLLRQQMVSAANKARVPIVYPFSECVYAGGLMAYAGDLRYAMARVMQLVAQILKGANPAGLAFEQSTRISLVVNMKTAQALKLAIPESVLLRADEVIR